MKECRKCQTPHNKNGNFCSRSCANSRTWTDQDKQKKSIAAKNSNACKNANSSRYLGVIEKQCLICDKKFTVRASRKNKKMCSKECSNIYLSLNAKQQKMGGYREGSGRSKSGYYKGIFCGSTYELAWVVYRIDNQLPVERFSGYLEDTESNLKYYPDFFVDGSIIEIKGFHTEKVDKKTQLATSLGYSIKVLYKKDLEKEFAWIKNRYKVSDLCQLFDEYKPKHVYTCCHCNREFKRERKLKTNIVFCSRQCVGKGHKGRKISNLKKPL